jgi:hypothetical protein
VNTASTALDSTIGKEVVTNLSMGNSPVREKDEVEFHSLNMNWRPVAGMEIPSDVIHGR